MIQYILETLAFQLAFLLVYDLFLKKETFFQWNRVYLLGTFVLSMVLPWIKIEALKTTVSKEAVLYPDFLFQLNGLEVSPKNGSASFWELLIWQEWIYVFGATAMAFWFLTKLFKISSLKAKGVITHCSRFTKIVVKKSEVAFSFFKNVFLGDGIPKQKEAKILAHELVHIKQWHSIDLLFFEVIRIGFWFNPLVYVYQNRVAELHEFIADAQVTKEGKKEQYQLLLSQAFQTQNLSFVNQFFKESLIKKRIVMLTKEKSKQKNLLKYLLLLPTVFGILIYTSCEGIAESTDIENTNLKVDVDEATIPFAVIDEVPIFPGCENAADTKTCFQESMIAHIKKHFNYPQEAQDLGVQGRVSLLFTIDTDGSITEIRKRGPHELLENEAERIVKRLPKMTPGKQNGKVVKVPFSIPITFRLQETADTQIPFPKMANDAEGLTQEIKKDIKKYNELLEERNRLLKNANRENPILINLEEQMTILQVKIRAEIDNNE